MKQQAPLPDGIFISKRLKCCSLQMVGWPGNFYSGGRQSALLRSVFCGVRVRETTNEPRTQSWLAGVFHCSTSQGAATNSPKCVYTIRRLQKLLPLVNSHKKIPRDVKIQ
jgi:hypothetical protein